MISNNTLIALVLVVVMCLVLAWQRKKVKFQKILSYAVYFVMLRTKLGLKTMDRLQAVRKLWVWLGYIGVFCGFIGMALISYMLVKGTVLLFVTPEAAPTIMPVLPIEAKGVFFVPIAYWILSIFIIAIVHEFAHGLVARAHNIPVKSSGFAFLGILAPLIPAAFVEPDEKKLQKAGKLAQHSVFAAGPFANILLAVFIVFAFGLNVPGLSHDVTKFTAIWDIGEAGKNLMSIEGLKVGRVKDGSPASQAGISPGQVITDIDGINIKDTETFAKRINGFKPGQEVSIRANGTIFALTLVPDETGEKGIMGVQGLEEVAEPSKEAIARYGSFGVDLRMFFANLVLWVFLLTIGIGLFNLLPLGPIDGGRMFLLAAQSLSPHGMKIWKYASIFFLGLIIINFVVPFFR